MKQIVTSHNPRIRHLPQPGWRPEMADSIAAMTLCGKQGWLDEDYYRLTLCQKCETKRTAMRKEKAADQARRKRAARKAHANAILVERVARKHARKTTNL